MEAIQKKFEEELNKFQKSQSDLNKHISQRQILESQLTENKFVKEELDLLKKDDEIFKLVGPVLLKQDLVEANQTVEKRIEYIQNEIKRHDNLIKETESKQENFKESLSKLQQQMQQAKLKNTKN
ncbi:prefoldin subunit 6 [Brachionus plicatilis]|uniref:Prefoldin subunit 6 n=1 Tax=Brachionus plicatilis TaxID=10195 RepID=A0A3M7PP24_BRAPC|nr:prefoldin subunit 6 [Brachionus plicatilis]